MKRLILKFYNEKIEDFCTRCLYFTNTIDTFFLISGILSIFLIQGFRFNPFSLFLLTLLTLMCFKIADFHPWFMIFSPIYLFLLMRMDKFSILMSEKLLGANILVFTVIQFLFMGLPDTIVSRDLTIPVRKFWNSLWTIAATAVSFPVSVYFASLFSFILLAKPSPAQPQGLVFWLAMFTGALLARRLMPKQFVSSDFRPAIDTTKIVNKVIILNIDGVRLDRFYEAELPFLRALEKESTYFPAGLTTVYRALTNPAFASILTGALPSVHGVKDNNIKRYIRIEAIPDLVKTILYGSMHVKHFSKNNWCTKIVSLPLHSIYKSDDIMLDWLKEDIVSEKEVRLFVADISEVDFLGHAYGSESRQYLEALRRTDRRIESFFLFLKEEDILEEAVTIICSDHGIYRIDHSYLLFKPEKYVPCLITGKNIRKDNPLNFQASIMDIALTVCYFLGVRYPQASRGRVFTEAIT